MKRTTATGSSGGLWVDRNVGSGVAGTNIISEDYNNLQEEVCNAITESGITLNGADQGQLSDAITARIAALKLSSNTTINITTSMTLTQIQALVDAVPRNLGGYTLTLQFADGTYTWSTYLNITGFYNGTVYIQGNTADSTISPTKAVNIVASGVNILLSISAITAYTVVRYIRFYGSAYTSSSHYLLRLSTGVLDANTIACAFEGATGNHGSGVFYNRVVGNSYNTINYYTNLEYGIINQYSIINGADNVYSSVTMRLTAINGITSLDLDESPIAFTSSTTQGGLSIINGEIRRAPGYNYYDLFTLSGVPGSISNLSRLYREGALLQGQILINITDVATGDITLTTPTGMTFVSTSHRNVGNATFYDTSTSIPYDGRLKVATTSTLTIMNLNANQTWGTTYPVAAANGDSISINVQIPIAEWD